MLIISVLIIGIIAAPCLAHQRFTIAVARYWCIGVLYSLKAITGVSYKVTGTLPNSNNGYIIASKHQSAFETILLILLSSKPIFIVKRELFWIPIFGWYLWRVGAIGIKRADGRKSLQLIKRKAAIKLSQGHQLIIFPEGTRHKFGAKPNYRKGIIALYQLGYPVVPVSLNSGYYWPKVGTIVPGEIIIKILPTIPVGLNPQEFMGELVDCIEKNIALPTTS